MKVWETNTIQIQQQFREAKPLVVTEELFNPLQDVMQRIKKESAAEKSSISDSLQANIIDLVI
ncbi:hypothetical protein KJ564_05810 [bacterium]|nr:hypothetical protein [bacterium]MBU1880522.1 hypothetical protein [bacterium]